MRKANLGIVGCGAVTQQLHLPASKLVQNIKMIAVVDKNLQLARRISHNYNIPYFFEDYHRIFDLVDGVLIALPHDLHAPVTIDFLAERIPVLCEKPMTISSNEAKKMIRASQEFNTPLTIGMVRRFYRSSLLVKRIISKGVLGAIQHFDFEEGTPYQWPTVSGFFFDRKTAGGGVLIDTGVHVLDLLLWWLGSDVFILKYCDDNLGGLEANCELYLNIIHKNSQVKGRIELSRERRLRNSYRIFGTNGWLEFFPYDPENINLYISRQEKGFFKDDRFHTNVKRSILHYFVQQLMDFGRVISGEKTPYVDAGSAYQVIKLIEACYNKREDIKMPWITDTLRFCRL